LATIGIKSKKVEKMLTPANVSAVSSIFVKIFDWLKNRQANSVYRRFFEKSTVLFCVSNREGEFVKINPAFAQLLGYQPEQLSGTKFMFFVHPDDQMHTIEAMERLREGAEVNGFRNRYRCLNGVYKTLEWNAIGNGEIHAVARIIEP